MAGTSCMVANGGSPGSCAWQATRHLTLIEGSRHCGNSSLGIERRSRRIPSIIGQSGSGSVGTGEIVDPCKGWQTIEMLLGKDFSNSKVVANSEKPLDHLMPRPHMKRVNPIFRGCWGGQCFHQRVRRLSRRAGGCQPLEHISGIHSELHKDSALVGVPSLVAFRPGKTDGVSLNDEAVPPHPRLEEDATDPSCLKELGLGICSTWRTTACSGLIARYSTRDLMQRKMIMPPSALEWRRSLHCQRNV